MTRLFDILVSFLCLVLFSPVIAFFAMLVIVESSGSAFYKQKRVGFNGKIFYLYKIRSMFVGSDKSRKPVVYNDPRVTRVGKFIRKTKIDELPQLWNVLTGDMSIVGPRPMQKFLSDIVPVELRKKILSVKPGMTGVAQVLKLDLDDQFVDCNRRNLFKRQCEIEAKYAESKRLWADVLICLKTIQLIAIITSKELVSIRREAMLKDIVYFFVAVIFLSLIFSGKILFGFSFIFLVVVAESVYDSLGRHRYYRGGE